MKQGASIRRTERKRRKHSTNGGDVIAQADRIPTEPDSMERILILLAYPCIIGLVLLFLCVRIVSEPDCWFHMAFGKLTLQTGTLPAGDVFSFTGYGNEWISTGWGSSILLHLLFQQFRSYGLVYLVFAIVALAFSVLYLVSVRTYGNRGSVMLLLLPLALGTYLRFSPRPEVFSLLFITLEVLILVSGDETARKQPGAVPRRLWLLPPLMIAWANLHGGFVIGLAPIGLYLLHQAWTWYNTRCREVLMRMFPCAVACVAWIINPYGTDILKLVFQVVDDPTVKTHLFEYLPLFKTQEKPLPTATYLGFIALTAVVAWLLIGDHRRVPIWQYGVGLLFLYLALHERRHVGISGFVMAGIAVPHLRPLDKTFTGLKLLITVLAVAGLVSWAKASGALGVGDDLLKSGRDRNLLPQTAVEYLQANRPPSNMFNTYGPGGYLIYFLGPETKVFIDGRFFVYEKQVWHDFIAAQDGDLSIDELCRKYDIKTFLVYIQDDLSRPNHLANRLTARSDFKLVFFDDTYAVFVRDLPETKEYLRQRAFHYVSPFASDRVKSGVDNPANRAEALAELERAAQLSNKSGASLALTAVTLKHMGDYDKARVVLSEGINLYPKNRVLRRMYYEMGTPFGGAS